MWEQGWNVVSFDLPGHGANLNPGETYVDIGSGLRNWATRASLSENVADTCNAQVKLVADWLIENGKSKDNRIATSGISRGGFMAIHAVNSVDAIGAAVGLVPATNLAMISAFEGFGNMWVVKQTAWGVSFKSTKPAYIELGNADTAVNTAEAARNVAGMIERMLTTNQIDFHISPGAFHAMPVGAESRAALWLAKVFGSGILDDFMLDMDDIQ